MSKRYQGGILGVGFNPLQAPNAPTNVTATAGDASASVAFTAPTNVGGSAITGYTVQSNPGGVGATGSASPITVSGLSNGTSYTFNVWALNSYGPSPAGGPSGSVTPATPRGLFAGGYTSLSDGNSTVNTIDYVTISTTGNATDFGDLIAPSGGASPNGNFAGCASDTRGIFGGGDGSNWSSAIEYVTIATAGNALSFGDLTAGRTGLSSASNITRGLFMGGTSSNVIDYVTIATTGNATDFGDLLANTGSASACASPTRAVVAGAVGYSNVIQYVTIATTGNATDFGDLAAGAQNLGSCSSSTRGLFGGGMVSGFVPTSSITYITIATTGNSTSFGTLSAATAFLAGCSSSTRGIFGGGTRTYPTTVNVIEYVTIGTTGNATDFGDLTTARGYLAACSNAHGGL